MDTLSYKTISVNAKTATKEWVVIDAKDQVLGRFASQAAMILRGKHKANYTPHADCGDNVIIINADKIRLTGRKWTMKEYVSHTGYPGGQRHVTPAKLIVKKPTAVLEKAIYGMIPKNRLGNAVKGNLYLYAGEEHPHNAQQPKVVTLKY
ncbi:MAG TPA: 50S ribosomal protein L13 [Bacteroidia bacterium]|nr:50S ribosomal protein L13 [Bacteroidia bacterium]HQF29143.1 50S ribosomal protein L13 [Bacteroidia bacterium]HQK97676.1 50S ribosomal protein L13 [Bacteroidia bacterium]